MMKTPCLVTEGTSHPTGRDTARKGARFPNCIFPVPSSDSGAVSLRAGLADLTGLFQAELFCDFPLEGRSGGELGRVCGWLCPLLDKARPADLVLITGISAKGNMAFRKHFSPMDIFKPTTLLCRGSCEFAFKVWIGWEGVSLWALMGVKGVGDTDTALHST